MTPNEPQYPTALKTLLVSEVGSYDDGATFVVLTEESGAEPLTIRGLPKETVREIGKCLYQTVTVEITVRREA